MGLFKKKPAVEPADIQVLRSEILELKERLESSEQGKVALEDRLSSIAATTMILSSTAQNNTAEIVDQIEAIHGRLQTSDAVGNKVDELHQRVIEFESRQPADAEPSEVLAKMAALSGRIEQVAQLAAAPAQPDDELAARLEQLSTSADTVDLLSQQLDTLSSRVNAQAEMADQLRALSERISLLQQRSADTAEITDRLEQFSMAAPMTDELGERVVELSARVASSEHQVAEARAKSDELEQRLGAVGAENSAELQSQLVALSSRIEAHDQLTQQLVEMEARLLASENELRATREHAIQLEQRVGEAPGGELDSQISARLDDQLGHRLEQHLGERFGELHGRLDQHDQITSHLAATAPAAEQLTSRLDELAARLASSEDELRSAAERAAALERSVSGELTADIEHRLGELSARVDAQSGLDEQLAELGRRAEAAEAAANAVRDQSASIAERFGSLEGRIGETDQRFVELGSRLGSSDERYAQLEGRLVEVHDRVGDVDGRFGEIDGRVNEVHERVNHVDGRVSEVDGRIGAAFDRIGQLDGRLGDVDGRLGQVAERSNELDQLRERIEQLSASLPDDERARRVEQQIEQLTSELAARSEWPDQLAALNSRISELQDRGVDVDRIHERLDQLSSSMPSTTGLHDEINRLAERLSGSEGDSRAVREHAAALEERLGNISTELANQLGELSNELDHLASREPVSTPAPALDEAGVQALKTSQVKLANEQARYEITFREDLAALAEQVRQLRGRS